MYLDLINGLRYNKIKLGAALFIVGRADRAFFLRNISGKKRGSPFLMVGLGRTYALLGRACTYTLQNSCIFVPPNSLRIEGKT